MISIPDKARFGGVEYVVELMDEPLQYNGAYLMGACFPHKKLIYVYNNPISPSSVEETWLHEALEGILDTYDIDIPHQSIKTIGVALHQFLAESKIDWSKSAVHPIQ